MTLNELFRRGGDTCTKSPPLIGELINQSGGQITIINPPYQRQPRPWRKGWARKLRIGGLYFYISNCKMKKRAKRDLQFTGYREDHYVENKRKLYERQEHKCPHCGQPFEYNKMESHHYLPVCRYPELQWSIRNMILLCHDCHKEVHMNPWKNIAMMQEKAQELGIDLKDRYDYGNETS